MKRLVPILCFVVFLGLAPGLPAQDAPLGFRLIVNADNPATAMAAKDLAKIFIKKTSTWSGWRVADGEVKVVAIDQHDNAVRQAFSDAVHGKSVSAIERYWQKMIFSGRGVPPDKADGDAAVIAYVRAHPGAIGYVSGAAALGAGVKELRIAE
jgi:ABC-type phosphate transport system substrate-binding protein